MYRPRLLSNAAATGLILLAAPIEARIIFRPGLHPARNYANAVLLATTGRSRYCVLVPGAVMEYEGREGRHQVHVTCTVLADTETVGEIVTRVVEEREEQDGSPVEVSRNFCAFDPATGNVLYFGEAVEHYRGGKPAGHDGSWRAGREGAKRGILVPGHPRVGATFVQESAPGVAMDQARVLSLKKSVTVPAGTFSGCLWTEETTPLEPNARERKVYAPGVGLVVDGGVKLVKYTFPAVAGTSQ